MRHLIKFFVILSLPLISNLAFPMQKHNLNISAVCRDNPSCTYTGEAITIDITITNSGSNSIGFPLAYILRRGPVIGLSDELSDTTRSQRINLATYGLNKKFTEIKPGQSVTFDAIISNSEIMEFWHEKIDILAKIRAGVKISIPGDPEPYLYDDSTFLHIQSRTTNE